MLDTTLEEAQSAFDAAKNVNSAVKNFLKREGNTNPALARFAKDFRTAATSGRAESLQAFVAKHYPAQELPLLVIARYAHSEFVEQVAYQIIDQHAEAFNKTYSSSEDGVTVKDEKEFLAIVKQVLKTINDSLKSKELPQSNFMRRIVAMSVFDEQVFAEVLKRL